MGNDWKISSLLKFCNQKLNSGIDGKKYKVYRKYAKYQEGGGGWTKAKVMWRQIMRFLLDVIWQKYSGTYVSVELNRYDNLKPCYSK